MIDTNELRKRIKDDDWRTIAKAATELLDTIDRLRAENAAFHTIAIDTDRTPFAAADAWRAEHNRMHEKLMEARRRIAELEGENAAKESDLIKWRMGDYGYKSSG